MKLKHWIVAFAVLGLLAIGLMAVLVRQMMPSPATPGSLDTGHAALATALLDRLDAGEFAAAHAMLAPRAAAELDAAGLENTWRSLARQLGGLERRGAPRGETIGPHAVTTIPLHYARMTLDARVSVDADGLIDGFRIVPAQTPTPPAPPAGDDASEAVDVTVGALRLPGTLLLPAGDALPAVVLVHGSGPHDRDQTIGPNRVFHDLAAGLAAHGIASLRYDKRTRVRPEGFVDTEFGIDDEVVDDAVAALTLLAEHPRIDPARVFVLGHSLGAMLAPRIAARSDAAGVIMLAAPARPLDEIVPLQVAWLAAREGEHSAQERAAIAEIEAGVAAVQALREGRAVDGPLLFGLPERYWRDLIDYDPIAAARALGRPLLLAAGGRDYQVTLDEFALWQQALATTPGATLRLYPRLNHLFVAGDGPGGPEEYLQPGTLEPQLIDDIAEWIDAQR